MKINEKIYSLRKSQNLSQEELADKLNVSRQTVSKWELGVSSPDFDKIVPLCEVFGITTEELLRGNKLPDNNTLEESKPDTTKALLICGAIFLYFIAIVSIIFGEEYLHLNDGIVVSIFLIICGLATIMIVYACMTRPSNKKELKEEEKNTNPVLKTINSIVTLLTTCIYLLISFITMAWHITWIIWVIYSAIIKIIELLFSLKEIKKDEE